MESKQDYFHSPAPKNIECFYSPFKLVRHDQDPFFINTLLLSPLHRISNSPFPVCPHLQINQEQSNIQLRIRQPNKIQSKISFQKQPSEQSDQLNKLQTPKNSTNTTNIYSSSSNKKYNLRVIDPQEKNCFNRDTQRSLRVLSRQAYEVFQNWQMLTYKQVSERIMENNERHTECQKKNKQKQSIKRRVYDALNVLIAVGKLQKNGKKISLIRKQPSKQNTTLIHLSKQLENKLKLIETKKKNLEQTKHQKLSLQLLIQRNLTNKNNDNKIYFPFIICTEFMETQSKQITKIKNLVGTQLVAIQNLQFNQHI